MYLVIKLRDKGRCFAKAECSIGVKLKKYEVCHRYQEKFLYFLPKGGYGQLCGIKTSNGKHRESSAGIVSIRFMEFDGYAVTAGTESTRPNANAVTSFRIWYWILHL